MEKKYGKLEVLRENKKLIISGVGRCYIDCKCECGKLHSVRKDHLIGGKIISCGCIQKTQCAGKTARNAKPPGLAAARAVWNNYKNKAKKRDYDFDIPFEQFRVIASQPCRYCGRIETNKTNEFFVTGVRAGSKKVNGAYCYNGMDRKNNNKGYTLENVVPCCGQCNIAKGCYSESEFLEWVSLVYNQPPKQVHQ